MDLRILLVGLIGFLVSVRLTSANVVVVGASRENDEFVQVDRELGVTLYYEVEEYAENISWRVVGDGNSVLVESSDNHLFLSNGQVPSGTPLVVTASATVLGETLDSSVSIRMIDENDDSKRVSAAILCAKRISRDTWRKDAVVARGLVRFWSSYDPRSDGTFLYRWTLDGTTYERRSQDVVDYDSERIGATRFGQEFSIPIRELTEGEHTLAFEVIGEDGPEVSDKAEVKLEVVASELVSIGGNSLQTVVRKGQTINLSAANSYDPDRSDNDQDLETTWKSCTKATRRDFEDETPCNVSIDGLTGSPTLNPEDLEDDLQTGERTSTYFRFSFEVAATYDPPNKVRTAEGIHEVIVMNTESPERRAHDNVQLFAVTTPTGDAIDKEALIPRDSVVIEAICDDGAEGVIQYSTEDPRYAYLLTEAHVDTSESEYDVRESFNDLCSASRIVFSPDAFRSLVGETVVFEIVVSFDGSTDRMHMSITVEDLGEKYAKEFHLSSSGNRFHASTRGLYREQLIHRWIVRPSTSSNDPQSEYAAFCADGCRDSNAVEFQVERDGLELVLEVYDRTGENLLLSGVSQRLSISSELSASAESERLEKAVLIGDHGDIQVFLHEYQRLLSDGESFDDSGLSLEQFWGLPNVFARSSSMDWYRALDTCRLFYFQSLSLWRSVDDVETRENDLTSFLSRIQSFDSEVAPKTSIKWIEAELWGPIMNHTLTVATTTSDLSIYETMASVEDILTDLPTWGNFAGFQSEISTADETSGVQLLPETIGHAQTSLNPDQLRQLRAGAVSFDACPEALDFEPERSSLFVSYVIQSPNYYKLMDNDHEIQSDILVTIGARKGTSEKLTGSSEPGCFTITMDLPETEVYGIGKVFLISSREGGNLNLTEGDIEYALSNETITITTSQLGTFGVEINTSSAGGDSTDGNGDGGFPAYLYVILTLAISFFFTILMIIAAILITRRNHGRLEINSSGWLSRHHSFDIVPSVPSEPISRPNPAFLPVPRRRNRFRYR